MKSVLAAAEAEQLLRASLDGKLPDERGRFGPFGGRYVPETLVPAFERLEEGVRMHLADADFRLRPFHTQFVATRRGFHRCVCIDANHSDLAVDKL